MNNTAIQLFINKIKSIDGRRVLHSCFCCKRPPKEGAEGKTASRGFILLFTIVVISVTVGITAIMINVANRQAQLSFIQNGGQLAFSAADAGMYCALNRAFPEDRELYCAGFPCSNNGVGKCNQEGEPGLKERFFFDFSALDPNSTACGVGVIDYNAQWGDGETGILIESYGYNICSISNSAPDGAKRPNTDDPLLIERKLLIQIPVVAGVAKIN